MSIKGGIDVTFRNVAGPRNGDKHSQTEGISKGGSDVSLRKADWLS